MSSSYPEALDPPPQPPTLASIDEKLDAILAQLAELTTRVLRLEVALETNTASCQVVANRVIELRHRVDDISSTAKMLGEAAMVAQRYAEDAAKAAGASYELARTLTRPYRERLPTTSTEPAPTSFSSKPPPQE